MRVSTKRILFFAFVFAVIAANVFGATDSVMPWDGILTKVQNALAGTTTKVIAGIMIIVAGIMVAIMEGGGLKKLIWVVLGIAIAVGASSFAMNLFGISTGMLIP